MLLLLTLITFAQTTPTKEETIKWICEKINAYGSSIRAANLPDDYIVTTTAKGGLIKKQTEHKRISQYTYYLNINDIISYKRKTFVTDAICLELVTYGNKAQSLCEKDNTIESINSICLTLSWGSEPNLLIRFETALDTLTEYNKKSITKETF